MPKHPEWEARLAAVVTQAHARPFAWGVHDCCLWAADCVQAQTGEDPASDVRGAYDNARDAAALIKQHGGMAALGVRAGAPIPPLLATHGDIGLASHEGRELLVLCNGDHWLATGPCGLVVLPLQLAINAWRVGHA